RGGGAVRASPGKAHAVRPGGGEPGWRRRKPGSEAASDLISSGRRRAMSPPFGRSSGLDSGRPLVSERGSARLMGCVAVLRCGL
ncbi:hypothetical protein, partial [Amycolatopsis rubida]|uniref:hypothetical protein n=1 Tax=Amycolatopsis rubida TaxID=112413 RepID=UPI001941D02D